MGSSINLSSHSRFVCFLSSRIAILAIPKRFAMLRSEAKWWKQASTPDPPTSLQRWWALSRASSRTRADRQRVGWSTARLHDMQKWVVFKGGFYVWVWVSWFFCLLFKGLQNRQCHQKVCFFWGVDLKMKMYLKMDWLSFETGCWIPFLFVPFGNEYSRWATFFWLAAAKD